jgi:hypothetical protein
VYFRVFSLQIGDLRPETSSLQTARSAMALGAVGDSLNSGSDFETRP